MIKLIAILILAAQSSWAIRTEYDSIHNQRDRQTPAEINIDSGTISIFRAGVLQSTGNTTIGDAAADLLTINPSSVTLPGATTIYVNTDLTILYSSPTVCSTFYMEPGQGKLVRSSAPAQAGNVTPNFEVVNVVPGSVTVHGVFLRSRCYLDQDTGADASNVAIYLRQTGTTGAVGTIETQVCAVEAPAANQLERDISFGFYPSTGPIDFSCESGGVTSARRCHLFFMGACR